MTWALDDICFIDSETRRVRHATCGDVTISGGALYSRHAFATIWGWGAGSAPVEVVALDDGFDERLTWEIDAPDWLKRFYDRADRGKAVFAAWNMAFDRMIWNGPESDFPPLRIDMTIDVMAQAAASGLPTKLGHAAKWLGCTQKLDTGSGLIKLFEPPNGATPQDRPEDWEEFRRYGGTDVEALRDIYTMTRPLPREEWEVYWANEAINDRGMGVDRGFMAAAANLSTESEGHINRQIAAATSGDVSKVSEVQRILKWAEPLLSLHAPAAREALIEKTLVLWEDGRVRRPEKLSLAREKLEKVLVVLDAQRERLGVLPPELEAVYEVLTLRHYGGSTTPKKFAKAIGMIVDVGNTGSRLTGQYVFNGAPGTGRFSSRGVQTHNLTRAHLGDLEEDAIEEIKEIAGAG